MNNPSEAVRLYPEQDHEALGESYIRHVAAMTSEGLHAKSDIAAQLAWRDQRITALAAEVEGLREKLRDMHRRAQTAESAIGEYKKIQALPPDGDGVRFVNGNFGRILLNSYCYKLVDRAEQAEADARRWQYARQFIDVDDISEWRSWAARGHKGSEAGNSSADEAIDAAIGAAHEEKCDG